jgi:CP family cyanate transporter-like MFS transporter
MPESASSPFWRGRILAVLGILLVAANLRSAVAALSPIVAQIRADVPLDSVSLGILGMLPPICFAAFGIVTPLFTRRASLELVTTIALVVMLAGHLLRAASGSFALLVIGSAITFAGMAVGNVLLPPLVKRYFPDRVGLMTSLYATVLAVSTLLPPLIAVPVANSLGWRFSVGMWAFLTVFAVLPWLMILLVRRPRHGEAGEVVEEADAAVLRRIWHAPIAWALAVVFAGSSINAYAMFAWLPEILHDTAQTDPAQAGALLSLYAAMGIPAGLLIPAFAARIKNLAVLIYLGVGCFLLGYAGLIFWPGTATWLWVLLAGSGPLLFPLCLILINLRTRTHDGAVALSGFVQGVGYTLGALGPLVVGLLHQLTGVWMWPILFPGLTVLAAALAGTVVARPRMLEDQLSRVATR